MTPFIDSSVHAPEQYLGRPENHPRYPSSTNNPKSVYPALIAVILPFEDPPAIMQKTSEGFRRNYVVRYLGVTPHASNGELMITLLYQFRKGNVKITQVSLDEFRGSETLKNEIKRSYGERGDRTLAEILYDPYLNGTEAAYDGDSPPHSSGIGEQRLQNSSLSFVPEDRSPSRGPQSASLQEPVEAKGKELTQPGSNDTYKKFESIRAAYETYIRYLRRRKGLIGEGENKDSPLSPFHGTDDGNRNSRAERPPSEFQYGYKDELLGIIEQANQADQDEPVRERQDTEYDYDSDETIKGSSLEKTGRSGMVPAMGVGGSRVRGIQEADESSGMHAPSLFPDEGSSGMNDPPLFPDENSSAMHDPPLFLDESSSGVDDPPLFPDEGSSRMHDPSLFPDESSSGVDDPPLFPDESSSGTHERPHSAVEGSSGTHYRPLSPVERSSGLHDHPLSGMHDRPRDSVELSPGMHHPPFHAVESSSGMHGHQFYPAEGFPGMHYRPFHPAESFSGMHGHQHYPVEGSPGIHYRPLNPAERYSGMHHRSLYPVEGSSGMYDRWANQTSAYRGVTYANYNAAYSDSRILGHPSQIMQVPQQISSGESHAPNNEQYPGQIDEIPYDYIGHDHGLIGPTRIAAEFGTSPFLMRDLLPEQTETYRCVTYSETAADARLMARGLAPPPAGRNTERYLPTVFAGYRRERGSFAFRDPQRPGAGSRPPYRPGEQTRFGSRQEQQVHPPAGRLAQSRQMSPSYAISEWREEDFSLITEEQYSRIVNAELEDEKPDYLRNRAPRHPRLREYQRRLLVKADHHRLEGRQTERGNWRREVEEAEYEAMSRRHMERVNQMETDMASRYRENYEDASTRRAQLARQGSAQQMAYRSNPRTYGSREQPSGNQ